MVSTQMNTIISKLGSIEEKLNYITNNMVEKEEILSEEDFNAYKKSLEKSNLVSEDAVKKQLGL